MPTSKICVVFEREPGLSFSDCTWISVYIATCYIYRPPWLNSRENAATVTATSPTHECHDTRLIFGYCVAFSSTGWVPIVVGRMNSSAAGTVQQDNDDHILTGPTSGAVLRERNELMPVVHGCWTKIVSLIVWVVAVSIVCSQLSEVMCKFELRKRFVAIRRSSLRLHCIALRNERSKSAAAETGRVKFYFVTNAQLNYTYYI